MSFWKHLLGEIPWEEPNAPSPAALANSLRKISEIQKTMLNTLDGVTQQDFISDFVRQGGILGVEQTHADELDTTAIFPGPSHYRVAQIALNHHRLEKLLKEFRHSLTQTFDVLNHGPAQKVITLDASTQQALTDIVLYKESLKKNVAQLVLKPSTAEAIRVCLSTIDQLSQALHAEFEHSAWLTQELKAKRFVPR